MLDAALHDWSRAYDRKGHFATECWTSLCLAGRVLVSEGNVPFRS